MLTPWKISYDKPTEYIKKERYYFVDKVSPSQSYVFPVVMYECDSWTRKKAECWTTDAFELWCWRRLLNVPWIARRSNQSILKEVCWIFIGMIDAEAEAPILWSPDGKSWLIGKNKLWCWKRLKAGGEGDDRRQNGWMAPPTQWTRVWANSERVKESKAWRAAVQAMAEWGTTEGLNNNKYSKSEWKFNHEESKCR